MPKRNKRQGNIRAGKLQVDAAISSGSPKIETVVFSFKYLDLHSNQKFTLDHAKDGYRLNFMNRLNAVSKLTIGQFINDHSKALRSHVIDFQRTSEPQGFSHIPEQTWQDRPWQFSLTSNEHGRVHGFIIDNVFFIVWLDPLHKLYN